MLDIEQYLVSWELMLHKVIKKALIVQNCFENAINCLFLRPQFHFHKWQWRLQLNVEEMEQDMDVFWCILEFGLEDMRIYTDVFTPVYKSSFPLINSAVRLTIITMNFLHQFKRFLKRFSECKTKLNIVFLFNAHFCTNNPNIFLLYIQ